jgi:hypothetical protein
MLSSLAVAVIVINNFIEERSKGIVRVVRTSINTDARLSPLRSRENDLSKCESILIFLVLELLPKLRGKAFGEMGLCAIREDGEVSDILWGFEVRADKSAFGTGFSNL